MSYSFIRAFVGMSLNEKKTKNLCAVIEFKLKRLWTRRNTTV